MEMLFEQKGLLIPRLNWRWDFMILHPFVILFFLLIICSLPIIGSLGMVQKVIAQTNTNDSKLSPEEGNVLVDDVIQNLKNKDINKALAHLNILNQQIAITLRQSPDFNSTATAQIGKILLSDTIQAVKNGDTNKAIADLGLVQ